MKLRPLSIHEDGRFSVKLTKTSEPPHADIKVWLSKSPLTEDEQSRATKEAQAQHMHDRVC